MTCPVCGQPDDSSSVLCPTCRAELENDPLRGDLAEVHATGDPLQARLLQAALEAHDIASTISQDPSGHLPEWSPHAVHLYVRPIDVELARTVIEAAIRGDFELDDESASDDPDRCRDCGRRLSDGDARAYYKTNISSMSRWEYWDRRREVCSDCYDAWVEQRRHRNVGRGYVAIVAAVLLVIFAVLIFLRP